MVDFIQKSWKAVVALIIPIVWGAAIESVDAVAQFVRESGNVWGGVVLGGITAVGVWLKANKPA